MMIVTDAQGHILWREGQSDVLRRADKVGLIEGTRWSEDAAAAAYRGELRPGSEAPAVIEERELLAATLRRAVLDQGDVEAMWLLAETASGADDVELAERLSHALPPSDPRHATMAARAEHLAR
jgi:hypothetical protein